MGEQRFIDLAVLHESPDHPLQVHGIPHGDGGDDQIEAAGPVALIFKRPITDLTEAVKEDRTREGVAPRLC